MADLLNDNNLRGVIKQSLCPLLGHWHIGKQMASLIFRHYFPTFFGPLMLHMSPQCAAHKHASLSHIGQLFMCVQNNRATTLEGVRAARDACDDNDILRYHAQNILDLVEFYIPIFLDYMVALKLGDWDTMKRMLHRAFVVLLSFDSGLYSNGIATHLLHLEYLERSGHPIFALVREDTYLLNEECVEISNSWLSKATSHDARRGEAADLSKEYILQK